MICLIFWPLLITLRRDLHQLKGLLKGFKLDLRPWESSKNWWRYDQMKFIILSSSLLSDSDPVSTPITSSSDSLLLKSPLLLFFPFLDVHHHPPLTDVFLNTKWPAFIAFSTSGTWSLSKLGSWVSKQSLIAYHSS